MIEFQNSIQDWIPAARYWVSYRSLVGNGLSFSWLRDMRGTNVFDHPYLPPTLPLPET